MRGGDKEPARAGTPTATPTAEESARAAADAGGNATSCVGRGSRYSERQAVDAFNAAQGADGVHVRYRELPAPADPQHERLFALLGRGCDVAHVDLVWVAELAGAGAVSDLTDYLEPREAEFMRAPLDAVRWQDRYWAVPRSADAGLVYYRRGAGPPATWADLYAAAAKERGLVYQGAPYESLTVHFLELAYGAGADVLSADGKRSDLDGEPARRALRLMVDGIRDGAVPAKVMRFQEEEARRAFAAGDATFMRNWPYAAALLQHTGVDYGASALPAFPDGEPASVLTGFAVVVAAEPSDRDAALALVDHLTGDEAMRAAARRAGVAPVLEATWLDRSATPTILTALELQRSIEQARPRPVTPAYAFVSRAIYTNVHAALTGRLSPEQALDRADRQIERALARHG